MFLKKIMGVDLGMFGEGAGAAEGAGAPAEGQADAAKGETKGAVPGRTRRGKSGEFANVLFGKQEAVASEAAGESAQTGDAAPEPAAEEKAAPTPKERRKAFLEMVNSDEYKDLYAEEVQRHINRRFSETKTLEAQMQAQQPIIDMLYERYSAGGDMAKIAQALESDNAYWQQAAEEAGMEVEAYKSFKRMQRENEALKASEATRQERERNRRQAEEWYRQADALKTKYPTFDLATELQDRTFVSMLQSGTPVEVAYRAMHFDSLMNDAVQATAADTEKRVVENVRAKGARPAENGAASRSGFTVRDDVSKLTKAERAEIARQAMRGKKISF